VNILLTGASSFTGYWFACALAAAGHRIVAPLLGEAGAYVAGVRAARVRGLEKIAEVHWGCRFGEDKFLAIAGSGEWDLLCHHAARVGDYRNPDFDVAGALADNTRSLPTVLRVLAERGLRGLVLTGSVFEQNEGAGTLPLRAFSPYGLSKGLTAEVFRYWCTELGIPLGKFVIPNPFGPFEEPRFCAYLMRCWNGGEPARVQTPTYVRDNIHVDLLAKAYVRFCAELDTGAIFARLGPSGYVENQGAFAQRFAGEVRKRTRLECRIELANQTSFSEPVVRINTEWMGGTSDWKETEAWDTVVEYYQQQYTN
jgi:UDP-glucose 4-epimerase